MSIERPLILRPLPAPSPTTIVGSGWVSIRDVLALAWGERRAILDDDPIYRQKLAKARATVERAESGGGTVYGVTTGVGACAGTSIPPDLRAGLPINLMRFHGCGTGRILDETEAAAVVAIRLITLAKGHSG
ncbi:MAG TPA: aromatic amino acid lyase, partial [Myxococcota bacterium]